MATQVVVITVVAAVVALGVIVIVVKRTVGDQLRQSYLEQSRMTASAIAGAAIDAVITEDQPLLQSIAEQVLARDLRIRSIVIENETGVRLAAAGGEESAPGVLRFAERLEYGGEEFGRVAITWSTVEFHGAIDDAARAVILWGGLILVCACSLGALGILRMIVVPVHWIDRFLRSARAAASPAPLPPQYSPEMQYLADEATGIVELIKREKELRSDADENMRRLRMLLNEVDHRVKNNLAAIVGLIEQGARSTPSATELAEQLIGRIKSISRTHEALARAGWRGLSLQDDLPTVLDSSLASGDRRRVRFGGPAVVVHRDDATPLCLALSELLTNARKHGALSTEAGSVDVRWRLEGTQLLIDWTEVDGPRVAPPCGANHGGTGLVLVRGLVEYQLGGAVDVEFRLEGLVVRFRVPFTRSDSRPIVSLERDPRPLSRLPS
jgi:two-component sensor histidine kinase